MTKKDFIAVLGHAMTKLSESEREERLSFYSEIIDDYMEEGLSEEEAVSRIGNIEDIISETTQPQKAKKKLKTWEIVLLAAGAPVWVSLLIAAAAVAVSMYVSLWAVLISLWAVFVASVICVPVGIILAVVQISCGDIAQGIALIGAVLVCAGLTILLFMGCKTATRLTVKYTRKLHLWIKSRVFKKEGVK